MQIISEGKNIQRELHSKIKITFSNANAIIGNKILLRLATNGAYIAAEQRKLSGRFRNLA